MEWRINFNLSSWVALRFFVELFWTGGVKKVSVRPTNLFDLFVVIHLWDCNSIGRETANRWEAFAFILECRLIVELASNRAISQVCVRMLLRLLSWVVTIRAWANVTPLDSKRALAGVINDVHPLDIDGETFVGSFLIRFALLVDLNSSESEVSDRRLWLVEEGGIYLISSLVLSMVCLDLYLFLNVHFNTRPLVLGDWSNLSLDNLSFLLIRFSVVDDLKNSLWVPLLKLSVEDSSLLAIGIMISSVKSSLRISMLMEYCSNSKS